MTFERLPVSVLVQTKNEEVAIRNCLTSVSAFGEVIVVDSESSDLTTSIAHEMGARVESFAWNGRYPKKKQWQLDNLQTQYEWILFIDADELVGADLVGEIREFFATGGARTHAAVDVPLLYRFCGKYLRYGHTVVKRCLVHRARVSFPDVDDLDIPGMGELEGHYQPVVDGHVKRFQSRLLHDDPDPVRTWFDRHNRYSDWEAGLRRRASARSGVRAAKSAQGRVFDRLPFKPFAFFFASYFLKLGIFDGRAGFDYAVALAFYYWQIGVKLRELERCVTSA